MKRIAIVNHKGGVGKSGVSVCLAGALSDAGLRTLIIDLDQQATSSEWLGLRPPGELPDEDVHGRVLRDTLAKGDSLESLIQCSPSGIDCVASGSGFASFDRAASGILAAERLLERSLESLPTEWDFVLLDCPPSLGLVTINALVASDLILVPVEPKSASRTPILTVLRVAHEVRGLLNPRLGLAGIVVTRVQPRIQHRQVEEWLRTTFADDVFQTAIRENTHISESHAFQVPVTRYLPNCNGAADFRALGKEFLERVQQSDRLDWGALVHG